MLLPLEILSDIILWAGGIKILRSISLVISKFNHNIIAEYDIVTQPINHEEVEKYLKDQSRIIRKFIYGKDTIKILKYYYKPDLAYTKICSIITFDKTIEYDLTAYQCQKFISNNANYDLRTTYNILMDRFNNLPERKHLAYKICRDTFNYYCNILKDEILWLYVFSKNSLLFPLEMTKSFLA